MSPTELALFNNGDWAELKSDDSYATNDFMVEIEIRNIHDDPNRPNIEIRHLEEEGKIQIMKTKGQNFNFG